MEVKKKNVYDFSRVWEEVSGKHQNVGWVHEKPVLILFYFHVLLGVPLNNYIQNCLRFDVIDYTFKLSVQSFMNLYNKC